MLISEINGVWLPSTERHLLAYANKPNWTYQKQKLDAAIKYVKRFRNCIDVGAHCGLWSMHLSILFGKTYAFEPMEVHRRCYERNVKGNHEMFPYALGDEEKTLKLFYRPWSTGDTGAYTDQDEADLYDVPVKTLDSFDLKDIDFIKMDCEGYEYFVLQGGKQTIAENRPVLVVEQKGTAEKLGIGKTEAIEWLKSRGYETKEVIAGDYIMVPRGWKDK